MDINVAQLFQTINVNVIMPEIILSVLGMALLLVNVFIPSKSKTYLAWMSFAGIVGACFVTVASWGATAVSSFSGSVILDNFGIFFKVIFLIAAGLAVLISDQYMEREDCNHGELYPIILFTTVGMMLMAAATDMMTVFLGLELMSISLYVLAGFNRASIKSNEAGMKYFLLGAFSTGFLLYGMALLYGITGSTRFDKIVAVLSTVGTEPNVMLLSSMFLILSGFLFKIAAAPFHMWTPDVYEGAPTPMTAFMSAGPKAAGFAVLIRLLVTVFPMLAVEWRDLLWILAVLTMTIGNFSALRQDNIKRMLAYSSIAHAGYAIVGLVAANATGVSGILFYMLSYTFMNIGAFAIIVLVGKKGEPNGTVMDFNGLGQKHPALAAFMALFLFSLAGMPPTAGFIGKFYIFSGAIQSGYIWLAVIGVLNSAASVYYYLRVIVHMYFKPCEQELDWVTVSTPVALALVIAAVGSLIPGIIPSLILQFAQKAVQFI